MMGNKKNMGMALHLALCIFACFRDVFLILLILPFCDCYFVFNVDFSRELFWSYSIMKVAGGHVRNSCGKSLAPGS